MIQGKGLSLSELFMPLKTWDDNFNHSTPTSEGYYGRSTVEDVCEGGL